MGLKNVSSTISVSSEPENVVLNYEQYILEAERFLRSSKVRASFHDRGLYADCSEKGTSVGLDDFRSDILLKMINYFDRYCFVKESIGERVIQLKEDSIPKLVFRCAANNQIDIYRSKIVEEIFLKEVDTLMSTIDSPDNSKESLENYLDIKRKAADASNVLDFEEVSKIAKDKKLIPRATKKAERKEFVDGVLSALSEASDGVDLKMNPSGSDIVNSFIHAKGKMQAARIIRKSRENKSRLKPVVEALQAKSQEIRDALNESGFFKRLTNSSIIKPSEMKLYKQKNQLDDLASKIRSSWDSEDLLLSVITKAGYKSIEDLERLISDSDQESKKICA